MDEGREVVSPLPVPTEPCVLLLLSVAFNRSSSVFGFQFDFLIAPFRLQGAALAVPQIPCGYLSGVSQDCPA